MILFARRQARAVLKRLSRARRSPNRSRSRPRYRARLLKAPIEWVALFLGTRARERER